MAGRLKAGSVEEAGWAVLVASLFCGDEMNDHKLSEMRRRNDMVKGVM
jgi:hypothetical protein